jgi:hypothetical protein
MDFKTRYPDYALIEHHIRRAHAERSVAVAQAIVGVLMAMGRGLKRFTDGPVLAAAADRRAIEADAFLKRSVAKY